MFQSGWEALMEPGGPAGSGAPGQSPAARAPQGGWRYATRRRWYRGDRPAAVARVLNRVAAWQYAHGILTVGGRGVTLEVRRASTGQPLRLPLVLTRLDGQRYLVAMLGERARWVGHVRAADGRARLVGARGTEDVRLVEVPVDERGPVLRRFLQIAPGARPHVAVRRDAPPDAFDAVAADHPVFRVVTDAAAGAAAVRG